MVSFERIKTFTLCLLLVGIGLLSSCQPKQERDVLVELLRDFESQYSDKGYKLQCYDEQSTDSTLITLLFETENDSTTIRIWDLGRFLCVPYFNPPLPPPHLDPEIIGDSAALQLKLEYEARSQAKDQAWEHLCDSLGHPYGLFFRGMICEGRLRVLVYVEPDIVKPFMAGHKLLSNQDIFDYIEYKKEESSYIMIEPITTWYRVTDQEGHFEFWKKTY